MNSKVLLQREILWLCTNLLRLRCYASSQNGLGENISKVWRKWTQYFDGEVSLYHVRCCTILKNSAYYLECYSYTDVGLEMTDLKGSEIVLCRSIKIH